MAVVNQFLKITVFCWVSLFCLCFSTASGFAEEVLAYQVKVVLKSGAEYDAVVKDKALVEVLNKDRAPGLEEFGPKTRFTLHYIRGLNGTMAVRCEDVKAILRLLPLGKEELKDIQKTIERRIDTLRDKEEVRLEKMKEKRTLKVQELTRKVEERKKLEAEAAKQKAEQEKFKWIYRFPPDEGWGPDKKKEIYQRGVVVKVYPNEEEQLFLDHFDEWLQQYEEWERLEKKKAEEEKSATPAGGAGEEKKAPKKEENKKSEPKKEKGSP